jgi:hypothetical protein
VRIVYPDLDFSRAKTILLRSEIQPWIPTGTGAPKAETRLKFGSVLATAPEASHTSPQMLSASPSESKNRERNLLEVISQSQSRKCIEQTGVIAITLSAHPKGWSDGNPQYEYEYHVVRGRPQAALPPFGTYDS